MRDNPPVAEQRTSKVSIVGVGSVGTAIAYACMIRGSAGAIALYDLAAKKAQAEVLDLKPTGSLTKVTSTVGDRVQGEAELFFAHLEPGEGVPKLFDPPELLRWLDQMKIYEIGCDEAGQPLTRPDW